MNGPIESNTKLVDLCSSWISHLPKILNFEEVIGIGMNEKELKKNKRLTKYYVHDLNKNPNIKMIPDESIDAVLCAVSVDYLIRVSFTTVIINSTTFDYFRKNNLINI